VILNPQFDGIFKLGIVFQNRYSLVGYTGKNNLTRSATHREAVCGSVIHSIFDAWHYEVLWTCMWTRTVLYQLYKMTRNCARFYETRESQRPDAWGQIFLTCNAMERGRAGGMMPLVKYFLHIELWIAGEPGVMPPIKYFLHIELWIVGELETCYLWQDLYRSSHETREGRSYRTPDALWRPYLLLLFIVVLVLVLLLLLFLVVFVLVNNTGISVPAVFLWPSIVIISLHVSFSFRWFGQETIEHD